MKIGLVTSEVTYIPDNYDQLILPLLKREEVCLLIQLKNRSPSLAFKALALIALGVAGIGKLLLRNTLFTSTKKRMFACNKNAVHFVELSHMNDQAALKLVKEHQLDVLINLRTRCIYRGEILSAPRLGCINVHHGLLPRYRGTMCDLYALYEGRAAGFSVHKMEKRVDAGEIYRVQEVASQILDYPQYLALINKHELEVLNTLIDEITKTQNLPNGIPNTREHGVVHTKNPDRAVIKAMLAKGMKL